MEVRMLPSSRRPGFGQKPQRKSLRPLLPQRARLCPVLEAGSDIGFLVYPPLADNEGYRIEYEGEGRYRFIFFAGPPGSNVKPIFSLEFGLPVGGVGSMKESVKIHEPSAPVTPAEAREFARAFIAPEDCGTPTGGVALRGATNFQTPEGWDSVYSGVFNSIERPAAPVLIVRVQTDWFAHDTEFRYVLQPGEAIHAMHTLPIGQVFFVPRQEVTLRDATNEEIEGFHQAKKEFFREKATMTVPSSYGLQYSPVYSRKIKKP